MDSGDEGRVTPPCAAPAPQFIRAPLDRAARPPHRRDRGVAHRARRRPPGRYPTRLTAGSLDRVNSPAAVIAISGTTTPTPARSWNGISMIAPCSGTLVVPYDPSLEVR